MSEDPIRCYWDEFAAGWIAETTDGTCISSCAGTLELAVSQVKDIVAANDALAESGWNSEFNAFPPREIERSPW